MSELNRNTTTTATATTATDATTTAANTTAPLQPRLAFSIDVILEGLRG